MGKRPIPPPLALSSFIHCPQTAGGSLTPRAAFSPALSSSRPLSAITTESGNYGDDEEEHLRNYKLESVFGGALAPSPGGRISTPRTFCNGRGLSTPGIPPVNRIHEDPPLGFTASLGIIRPPNPMLKNLSPSNTSTMSRHQASLPQNRLQVQPHSLGPELPLDQRFSPNTRLRTIVTSIGNASSPSPSSSSSSVGSRSGCRTPVRWPHPPFREEDDEDPSRAPVQNQHLQTKSPLSIRTPSSMSGPDPKQASRSVNRTNTISECLGPSNRGVSPGFYPSPQRRATSNQTPGNWNATHMDILRRNPNLMSAAERTSRYQLTLNQIIRKGPGPVAQGSYGEVWKGLLFDRGPSVPWRSAATEVAIKVIKVPQQDHERLLKRLFREILPICDLEHPNIAALSGYVMHRNEAWIVSPWQKGGNAMQYLSVNPNANRLKLILDIATGLLHLHSQQPPTIHSDLKGDNILIGDDGVARLSDFGLADLLDDSLENSFVTSSFLRGCVHFLAPELLAGEGKTTESDIWALGGLILQIASSRLPYYYLNRMQVVSALCAYQTPNRDQYEPFPHNSRLWPLIMGCCRIDPKERWTASQVLSYLHSNFFAHELASYH